MLFHIFHMWIFTKLCTPLWVIISWKIAFSLECFFVLLTHKVMSIPWLIKSLKSLLFVWNTFPHLSHLKLEVSLRVTIFLKNVFCAWNVLPHSFYSNSWALVCTIICFESVILDFSIFPHLTRSLFSWNINEMIVNSNILRII